MIKVMFVNSEVDYIEASRACYYGSRLAGIDLIIEILVLLVSITIWVILGFSWILVLIIVGCILGLIIRMFGYFVLPKIRYRKEPKYKDEYLLEFDDEGIHFKTKSLESKLEWSLYNKVIETDKIYILVYGKYNFSIIPKRALLTETDKIDFKILLDKYIKEKVNKI